MDIGLKGTKRLLTKVQFEVIYTHNKNIMLTKQITFLSALLFIIIGCGEKSELEQTIEQEKSLSSDSYKNLEREFEKGVYPTNHSLMRLRYSTETKTWKDYYKYFLDELPKYKDEHYYENIEWMNISFILSDPSFSNEADIDVKEALFENLAERSFVNDPSVALALLNSMRTYLSPLDYRDRLSSIKVKNEQFLKDEPENFKKYQEVHSSSLDEIMMMMYLIRLTGEYPTTSM